MDATGRFIELVQGPEAELQSRLDEAALLIAAHGRPELDVAAYCRRFDELAAACPEASLDAVRYVLFDVEKFSGNTDNYYDPRNSYLDQVLDRRTGIPITLSLVLLEVGWRLALPIVGLGLPGHFLVRLEGNNPIVVDPFRGGVVVRDVEDALTEPPIGSRALLARMLANLKQVFETKGDGVSLEWVLRLRTAIPGVPPVERVELANVLTALGRFPDAALVLDDLVGVATEEAGARLRAKAAALRARLN